MKAVGLAMMLALAGMPLSPAPAKDSGRAAASDGKDEARKDTKDKLICRSEPVTGSRTQVKRTCMTQAQWDDLAERTRNGLRQFDQQSGKSS